MDSATRFYLKIFDQSDPKINQFDEPSINDKKTQVF